MTENTMNKWTPWKGGVMGFAIGGLIVILMDASCASNFSVPKSDRLNEPCHYGAKPMMVEDGASVGKHRVVCGCSSEGKQ